MFRGVPTGDIQEAGDEGFVLGDCAHQLQVGFEHLAVFSDLEKTSPAECSLHYGQKG